MWVGAGRPKKMTYFDNQKAEKIVPAEEMGESPGRRYGKKNSGLQHRKMRHLALRLDEFGGRQFSG